MIPLGVLASARVAAGGGLHIEYVGEVTDWSNRLTTLTGLPLGAEAPDRRIIVVWATGNSNNSAGAYSAATLNGIPLAIDAQTASRALVAVGSAAVPTGTTATLALTSTTISNPSNLSACVYRVTGGAPVVDNASIIGPAMSVTGIAGGFIIAAHAASGSAPAPSWSGLDVIDYDNTEADGKEAYISGGRSSAVGPVVIARGGTNGIYTRSLAVAYAPA